MTPYQLVLALAIFSKCVTLLPNNIKIGGFFEKANSMEELAFKYAVDNINRNSLLPNSRVMAQIERIPSHDSFYASKRVCHSLSQGVAALFGPNSPYTAHHVQSICDSKEIPHIETRWDYRVGPIREQYSINLYPYPPTLSKAYLSLVQAMEWTDYLVLYEDNEGLVRLQELLKYPSQTKTKNVKVSIRQLLPGPGNDYRSLLKEVKLAGMTRIVLDCAPENVRTVLMQAQQVGMMTAYHNYLITTLDLHMVELEDFKYGGTNISALRLVDPAEEKVQHVVREWIQKEIWNNRQMPFSGKAIKTETALMYDAALLFATALGELDRSQEVDTVPLSCDSEETWQHGNSLINYMKLVEMDGLSGKIKFDGAGFRSDFKLDIVELKREGLVQVGVWDPANGANFTRNYTKTSNEVVESLHNKTLIVSTILNDPFLMLKEKSETLVGNARYEGYSVDLVEEISKILGFNYTIKLVEDGKYGSFDNSTGKWNGMIGELQAQKADLVVADITITYEREQGVDFTMPFMNLGVTILYKKPTKKDPNLFSFLSPLSFDVWIYIITAYLAVSLLLFTISRLSPYEKTTAKSDSYYLADSAGLRLARPDPLYEAIFTCTGNPVRSIGTQAHVPRAEEEECQVQTFTAMNSFWFILAALLGQGVDILPKAFSTRMIAALWWFFTLIMISSYTANLAAFLTVERMESPIESAEDLAKQQKIKYGAVQGGSTAAFFRDSKISTYEKMWQFMDQNKNVWSSSNKEGVERVLKEDGQYAFMMESTVVDYVVERQCELTQVGTLLDNKGYGIGLPPNSPYRTPMTNAILQLQEGGKLHVLKEKWWKRMRGGGQCEEKSESGKAASLSIANVGGIFVVLLAGLGIACITACIEYIWTGRQANRARKLSMWGDTSPRSGGSSSQEEILRNGFDKLDPHGVTHLDLAAHGTVSLSRCSTMKPTSGSVHSLPSAGFGSCAVPPGPNITLLPHPPVAPAPVGGPPDKLMGGAGGWNPPVPHYVRYHHQEQCPHYNNLNR